MYAVWPPGKELWVPPPALWTSHGKRRVVTLRTVSRCPDCSCDSQQGKASIEPYMAPTSSAKLRRSMMFWRAVDRPKLPALSMLPAGVSSLLRAKKRVLQPATYPAQAMSRMT